MTLLDKISGLGKKAKAITLAGVVGITGLVSDAYSQVVLSIQPRNTEQTQFNANQNYTWDIVASSNATSPINVSSQEIGQFDWNLNLDVYNPANGGNTTISNPTVPSISDANNFFSGYTTNHSIDTTFDTNGNLGNNQVKLIDFGTATNGPSNRPTYLVASFDAQFGSSLVGQNFTWSISGANVLNIGTDNVNFVTSPYSGSVTAVPESSTTAAVLGLAALAGAAAYGGRNRRGRREEGK